jgi:hypothetical protein
MFSRLGYLLNLLVIRLVMTLDFFEFSAWYTLPHCIAARQRRCQCEEMK